MGAFPTESGVKDAVDEAGSIDVHIFDSASSTIDPLTEDGTVAEVSTVVDQQGGTLDEVTTIKDIESATIDSIDGTLEEVSTVADIQGGTLDSIDGTLDEVEAVGTVESATIDAVNATLDQNVTDRTARANTLQSPAGDLSAGVSAALNDNDSYTLFLSSDGGETVNVTLSPNGGTDAFTIPESPIEFLQAGDDVVKIDYDADQITLDADGTTPVQAIVREVI